MNKLYVLFTFVLSLAAGLVSAQDIDQKNKALFDQTVDKLNFRTIEYVYDRKYPRKKFPNTQADFKTRKTFDDFEGNAAFKKLFLNYNDVSEKFKKKFGNGRYDLASFEKGLGDILINKDFEFFISSLTKDDKIQLIKSLQQINKKGVVQFVDASGKPRGIFSTDSVIEEKSEPIVQNKENTVAAEQVETASDSAQPVINTAATPEEVFQEKAPRRDWLTWLALVLSGTALAFAISAKLKEVPALRNYVNNNFQKKTDGPLISKVAVATSAETTQDPALKKQLENLTREVEGLYAQMDELLHKNSVLEQKLAGTHPKPFEVPKTAYFEPETEPVVAKATPVAAVKPETVKILVADEEEMEEDEEIASHIFTKPAPTYAANQNSNATEVQPEVTLFLSKPDRNGFFWNDEVTRMFTPNRSLFTLKLADNDVKKGRFELVLDKAQQKLALENPDLYLKPVCDIAGDPATGQRLVTETPGNIVLNGDQWVLVRKAQIKVV
ncbi:hypothetical protein I5M27_12410 [Adhaeribacter sp. BT258]|uniref:Uncharacterized protein n=1 Tax=Adhaeribacter terrigena TaxID=2793070 RepID=A0ABS1C313_9BACT|nr:hypothetical protein [Adhaeribacter terrigena]MBK0403794.1 hypothetical protein [Adhaeribacter terrigena]